MYISLRTVHTPRDILQFMDCASIWPTFRRLVALVLASVSRGANQHSKMLIWPALKMKWIKLWREELEREIESSIISIVRGSIKTVQDAVMMMMMMMAFSRLWEHFFSIIPNSHNDMLFHECFACIMLPRVIRDSIASKRISLSVLFRRTIILPPLNAQLHAVRAMHRLQGRWRTGHALSLHTLLIGRTRLIFKY